jgi:hypothetical protein
MNSIVCIRCAFVPLVGPTARSILIEVVALWSVTDVAELRFVVVQSPRSSPSVHPFAE